MSVFFALALILSVSSALVFLLSVSSALISIPLVCVLSSRSVLSRKSRVSGTVLVLLVPSASTGHLEPQEAGAGVRGGEQGAGVIWGPNRDAHEAVDYGDGRW